MADSVKYFDPYYVQVTKAEFARIIGRSVSQFDVLRKTDERCPKGYRSGTGQRSLMHWRLSEAYRYSDQLIQDTMNTKNVRANEPEMPLSPTPIHGLPSSIPTHKPD